MVPIAVLHGLTESASWAGAAVYVTHLGEQYWREKRKRVLTMEKKQESYVYRFISIFYVFVFLAQVRITKAVTLPTDRYFFKSGEAKLLISQYLINYF